MFLCQFVIGALQILYDDDDGDDDHQTDHSEIKYFKMSSQDRNQSLQDQNQKLQNWS